MARIVVTGYAGFIGSNLTRMLLNEKDIILGIDCHTYAARPFHVWNELKDADSRFIDARVDIREYHKLSAVLEDFKPDQVYHLAAESHVCRSIEGPRAFAETNFMGTFNLLEALRKMDFKGKFVHISTDEAFGELNHDEPPFDECTSIDPRSPYSSSKAASDLMVKAYVRTYGLNACITRCTNNFGPNQHEEKLIPKAITSFLKGDSMTLHGDGSHVRDWIFVDDHCRALIATMKSGRSGEIYCVGSGYELSNKQVIDQVQEAMREALDFNGPFSIRYTHDRPTDDLRYAVKTSKIEQHTGWTIDRGKAYFLPHLVETVKWYADNR